MRDIKFRGMTKKGSWVHGSLVTTTQYIKHMPKQHTKTWIVTSSFGNGGWFNINNKYYVIPYTVGQNTGLLDKNGIEIYEGDILKDTYGFLSVITWHKDFASFYCNYSNDRLRMSKFGDPLEIIGNIHQNHNLLNT